VADPKKLRLTFLWSDESALVQDFNKGHSEKMVEWADAFFGKYGLKLEVYPKPGGPTKDAYPYCLVKSGGFDPDVRTAEELELEIAAELRPLRMDWFPVWKALDDIDRAGTEEAKTTALDSLRAQIRALPQHHPDRADLEARFDVLFDEFLVFSRDLAGKRKELQRIEEREDEVERKYLKQRQMYDTDTPFRLQIGEKILICAAQHLAGLRTTANAMIPDPWRLKIIHCRFGTTTSRLLDSMTPRTNYLGVTRRGINYNVLNGKIVFDGPFILVNVNRHDDITLAHEIVHTTGRGHPAGLKLKNVPTWISTIHEDPATGRLVLPPIVEYVNLGAEDGAANDIMNYQSKSQKPEDTILTDDDRDKLIDGDFVRPPPGSDSTP
jgi:hypothetical protein